MFGNARLKGVNSVPLLYAIEFEAYMTSLRKWSRRRFLQIPEVSGPYLLTVVQKMICYVSIPVFKTKMPISNFNTSSLISKKWFY